MGSSLTVEIINAVADAKGIQADELETPLQEHIDTDAIEMLAAHETTAWTLSFKLPNHTVTVTGDGLVVVDNSQERTWE